MAKHVCGQCLSGFSSEAEYLNHKCSVTGFKPSDQNHFNQNGHTSRIVFDSKKLSKKLSEQEILLSLSEQIKK